MSSPASADPTVERNWVGGEYGIDIRLAGSAPDSIPTQLQSMLKVIWSRPEMHGPYLDRTFTRKAATLEPLIAVPHEISGVATLPCGATVVCRTVWTADLHEALEPVTDSSVSLLIPLGSWALAGRMDATDALPPLEWCARADEWFVEIAIAVHAEAPFEVAAIGFMPEAPTDDAVPNPRTDMYLVPTGAGLRRLSPAPGNWEC